MSRDGRQSGSAGEGRHEPEDSIDAHADAPSGESRWPSALVVLVLVVIPFLLPSHVFPRFMWIFAPVAVGLLIAMTIADPGRIDRRSDRIHGLSIALTSVLVLASVVATTWLVHELVQGAPDLQNGSELLEVGSLVWIDVNLTFALLYWELDGGGPARRLHASQSRPDLAFPEHMNPQLAVPGWRPVLIDYLYLGFTNATAFSPTDVMPLAHWAKMAMAFQAILSIVILSLVIANAVNILG